MADFDGSQPKEKHFFLSQLIGGISPYRSNYSGVREYRHVMLRTNTLEPHIYVGSMHALSHRRLYENMWL